MTGDADCAVAGGLGTLTTGTDCGEGRRRITTYEGDSVPTDLMGTLKIGFIY